MARLMAIACVLAVRAEEQSFPGYLNDNAKKALIIVDAQKCNIGDTSSVAIGQMTTLLQTGENELKWDLVIHVVDEHPFGTDLTTHVSGFGDMELEYDQKGRLCNGPMPEECAAQYEAVTGVPTLYEKRIIVPNQPRTEPLSELCTIGSETQKLIEQLPRRRGDIILGKGNSRTVNSLGAFENAFENAVNTGLDRSMNSDVWINNRARAWSAGATETSLHTWLLNTKITHVFVAGSNDNGGVKNTLSQAVQIERRRVDPESEIAHYSEMRFHVITDAVVGEFLEVEGVNATEVATIVAGFKTFVPPTATVDGIMIWIAYGAGGAVLLGALIFFGMNYLSDEGKMD